MKELWEKLSIWPGWRRYAPAAGSAVAHAIAFTLIAGMAAATAPRTKPLDLSRVTVELITEVATPPPMRQPPPAPTTSSPQRQSSAEPLPVAPPKRREQKSREPQSAQAPTAQAPGAQARNDDDAVALPPGPSNVPLGLKPLLQINPCSQRLERVRGDCDRRWAKLAEQGQLIYAPDLDRLAELYPDFKPEPGVAGFPGAYENLSASPAYATGGRIMAEPGVMPGGPGGGTGLEAEGGRLPPKNWQHQDPAFGRYNPSWLP